MFSPFVLLLCTLWELCARILKYILLFTDQKKKKNMGYEKAFNASQSANSKLDL